MSGETIKHNNYQNQSQQPILREKHTVHWFRKGLRLHDNPALKAGIKGATTFRCLFIIDPWFAGSSNVGINKWRFLLQCLEDLDHGLRKLNSRLFVIRGQPAEALPKLFKEWNITCLTFEEDPEPFGKVRDQNVSQMCKELGIEVISAVSHTLYNLDTIIEKNNGQEPLTYHKFQAVIASMNPPVQVESVITQDILNNAFTPIMEDHDDKYNVPTLDELGFDTDGLKPPVWIGGETEALARLERHLERKAWVASFGRPKMTPQSLLATQTGLSPYLRFGCLSTRLFYHQLTDLYKKIKKTMPPLSLHGQLLWREFFYCAATKNPNFDKMEGNQICVQIPWDKNAEALAKWSNGQTGFPWIDAIMTQLREEGWIHHLARHAVACFLTRGDLWISWEEGMKVFDELLLDADWSNNAGMWMWLSCSSFFQQFFHCYCPVRFGRKADPNGDYIRRFLPILKNFPTKYIHEPWNAPESVQRAAKCVIGKDYPVPMVNHAVVSRTNMERMKQVYLHLTKYRIPVEEKENSHQILSPITSVVSNTQTYLPYAVSSPSPTTVIVNTNNSGNYLCQQFGRNRPTSTIISSDINHQQNSDQNHQLLHQQQQHQQPQFHQQNQHNELHHYHNNQDYQISEQQQQQQQQKQQYNKNISTMATIAIPDYVKLQQRQSINDSDCLSINIYDNIRQLQQNNYQIDYDDKLNQNNQNQQNINYENQLNLGGLSVNIENIKYSRYNNQQYNRIKINDHNNCYKSTDTISSDDLNNYQKNNYINNSIIMEYGYNDYNRYVDGHLLTDQYKNEYNNVGNVGIGYARERVCSGGDRDDNDNGRDKTVIQNDTNFNSNNNNNNNNKNINNNNNSNNNNHDNDQQHQQQYQILQCAQQQQQQIDNNDNDGQNNIKLNFKCELEGHDK